MSIFKRYTRLNRIDKGRGIATSEATSIVHKLVESGQVPVTRRILKEDQRLDHLATEFYGDATLWWVIAAASGIGWGLQVPAGTMIFVPSNIGMIYSLVR